MAADLVDSHDLAHYVTGAGAVDASEHPSLVTELARLRTLGFLGAGDEDTTSRIFQVTREPGLSELRLRRFRKVRLGEGELGTP